MEDVQGEEMKLPRRLQVIHRMMPELLTTEYKGWCEKVGPSNDWICTRKKGHTSVCISMNPDNFRIDEVWYAKV
jgi:hypothetical protein